MESKWKKALFVACFLLVWKVQANGCDSPSSLMTVNYVPFRNHHLPIYKSTCNLRPKLGGNKKKQYFFTPILLLQPTTAQYQFNNLKLQHTVTFDVVLWNANAKLAVYDYMNKEMNTSVTKKQIKPFPFDELLLNCETAAETCQCPKEWHSNRFQKIIQFNMACPSEAEALKIVNVFKRHPKQLHSLFNMMFDIAGRHSREVILSVRPIRYGGLMSELEHNFPHEDDVFLTANDTSRLLFESTAHVMAQIPYGFDEVVSEESEQLIYHALRNMLVTGAHRVDSNFKSWDSVYWNTDNYRPDELARYLNELKEKLDMGNQNRLVDAMCKENKNVSELIEILHSSTSEHNGMNLNTAVDQLKQRDAKTAEKIRVTEESFSNVEWIGKKFVPKSMTLTRVNLRNARDEIIVEPLKVSVSFLTATRIWPVEINRDTVVNSHLSDDHDTRIHNL